MSSNLLYKETNNDIRVEYEIIPYASSDDGVAQLDELLRANSEKIAAISKQIEELQVNADAWDYSIASISGILAGLFDVFFVGELSLAHDLRECNEIGTQKANEIVKKAAKLTGYKEKEGDTLADAIDHLEKKFHIAADQNNIKNAFGGGLQHHLRDFSHHPTIVGWVFSMITQYTGFVFGTDPTGMLIWKKVENTTYIGKDHFEKILFGTIRWLFHMVSDMAGSVSTAGGGTGLPGPILSLIKELDGIRVKLKSINGSDGRADEFTKYLSKLFNGTALADRDVNGKIIKGTELKFDFRTEIGVLHNVKEVSKLFLPIIINECVVRSFYFIKHFVIELKDTKVSAFSDLNKLNWKSIIPFNNATLTRMLTISIGTMEIIDVTDATIKGAIAAQKAGIVGAEAGAVGGPVGSAAGATTAGEVAFWKTFALNVNYVGIGRLVLSFGSEFLFEYKRQKALSERIKAYDEALNITNAKVAYCERDMWISALEAGRSIDEAYQMIGITEETFNESFLSINNNLKQIGDHIERAEDKNPGLKDDMLDTLRWGI